LSFTSLSKAAAEVLTGHIPSHWDVNPPSLQAFLASFTIPDRVKAEPPISTNITTDNVSRGFRKWRETTATSPSGRHLGHYKAVISDPSLLSCLTKFLHIALNTSIALSRWSNAVNPSVVPRTNFQTFSAYLFLVPSVLFDQLS
jgi:hypothetical protein